MNYQELEKVLQGPLTYTNTSDKKLIELFLYINEIVDEYQCIFFIISLLPMFTQGL